MRISQVALLVAVAGLSFAVGRAGNVAQERAAHAQHRAEPPPPPTSPEVQAMIEFATPSRHHRALDALIGEWSGEFTMRPAAHSPPFTMRASITREWVLGGRFVRETVMDEGDGGFEGVGYIGYDNFDGQYVMVWMDTMSTGIQFDMGTYHPHEKVIHARTDFRDPASGRLVNAWSKMDLSDPDRHVLTGTATDVDGHKYNAMRGVLVRTPKSAAD
jgi:hypothetical protein